MHTLLYLALGLVMVAGAFAAVFADIVLMAFAGSLIDGLRRKAKRQGSC
jgi:hypothetical protein